MLSDGVFAIREEAINSLIKLSKQSFSKQWLEEIFTDKIEEFLKHDKFMMRIMAIH